MSKLEKILLLFNLFIYFSLGIFSYAYVDLNLTISKNSKIVAFVNSMQALGYFNRPAATLIFVVLVLLAFSFFALNLWFFYKSKLSAKYLKLSAVINTLILVFAYPFLSSDLFNYLFDAKIILKYGSSPYTHKALDFPQDEWLRFMRWTHRYSPYGPVWLGYSLLPAVLGFGKFTLNFLSFKIFISLFHLVNAFLIYKIVSKVDHKMKLFATAFYVLNPLFLIEGVANAHNDVLIATFILLTLYSLVIGKRGLSFISIVIGTLIKYIPILNLPWILLAWFKKINFSQLIALNLVTMVLFTLIFSTFRISVPFVSVGSTQVQFQPWYLFWTIPLVPLLPSVNLFVVAFTVSISAILRYLPFLYWGDWSQPGTIAFMQTVTVVPPLIVSLFLLSKKLIRSR